MGKLNFKKAKPRSYPDYTFMIIVGLLVVFGLVMLASASFDLAQAEFGDSYHYLKHQVAYGLSFGLVGFLIGFLLYYNNWRKLALLMLGLNILALLLVFTPLGLSAKGATRWLTLGPLSFQPGEVIKLTFLVYLASWISKNKIRSKSFSEGFLPFIILLGSVMILLLLQPSTTTAVIIFAAAVIMYFASGAKIRFL
ncbi:MAG: FtsW/RodA/SpoVE family cell cycle protein, partial [Candidatus Paceibacterota bacterium]